jgi:hypothetical protein
VACKVLVEKILKVGDQRSIVKTCFVTVEVQNISIAIAILALFLLLSNFHKMKIPTLSTKSSTWAGGIINFEKKIKISNRYLRRMEFHTELGGGGETLPPRPPPHLGECFQVGGGWRDRKFDPTLPLPCQPCPLFGQGHQIFLIV